jgi:ABC-type multidrug transport system fused ATPase/permease subunit
MQCLSEGERFSKLLRSRPSVVEKEGATCLEAAVGRIEFDNVSFSYPGGGKPAVEKISFTVEGGKTVS